MERRTFKTREANGDDMVHVVNIDVKSFYEAWDTDTWLALEEKEDLHIAVALEQDTPIGMVAFLLDQDDPSIVRVLKVAVLPLHRRQGVSRFLLGRAIIFARNKRAKRIEFAVPESFTTPGEPEDITGWMSKMKFLAKRIVKDEFTNMGRSEDGVLFTLDV